MRTFTVLFLLVLCFLNPAKANGESREVLRIGIIAYDDVRTRDLLLKNDFEKIGYSTLFARGTADEVLDWVNEGLVDIALLSPGAFAATSAYMPSEKRNKMQDRNDFPYWDARYLATRELGSIDNEFALDRRKKHGTFVYQALALANKDSWKQLRETYNGTDAEVVRQASQDKNIQFVFGDPLSLSGTIFPRAQLKELRVDIGDNWEYSFSHKETIKFLLEEPSLRQIVDPQQSRMKPERMRIGFVYDASIPDSREESQKLVVVKLPPPSEPQEYQEQINEMRKAHGLEPNAERHGDDLPGEVLVTRPSFDRDKRRHIRSKLLNLKDPEDNRLLYRDQRLVTFSTNQKIGTSLSRDLTEAELIGLRVRYWAKIGGEQREKEGDQTRTDLLGDKTNSRRVSVAEIVHSMRHYERGGSPARLALVLSGGGAKCAYQAGAIDIIEAEIKKLASYKLSPLIKGGSPRKPDIELVVGTSGGALNAVPTAIGLTTKNTNMKLADLWKSVNLTDILKPSWYASIMWGMVLGTLLSCITSLLSLILYRPASLIRATDNPNLRWSIQLWLTSAMLILVMALASLKSFNPDVVSSPPTTRLEYYVIWMPLQIAFTGIVVGLSLGCAVAFFTKTRPSHYARPYNFYIFLFSLASFCYIINSMGTISDGGSMQSAVLTNLRSLFSDTLANKNHKQTDQQIKTWLKEEILDNDSRQRDLVMAVSVLGSRYAADRYVYLPATGGANSSIENISAIQPNPKSKLNYLDGKENLVDLLVGSGTIFPIFPARNLPEDKNNQGLFVIDGGFAHNIPIEAAVDWGATHIIAIEASPIEDLSPKTSLLDNLHVAFDHLFAQAQLSDVRSRSGVEIYTLQPQKTILNTFEFIPAFVTTAVETGRTDTKNGRFLQYSRDPKMESLD